MATAAQLETKLLETRLLKCYDIYVTEIKKAGMVPISYGEYIIEATPKLDPLCKADANAIWAFLNEDCRVESGIDIEVDAGIGLLVDTHIPCQVDMQTGIGATTDAGPGATTVTGIGRTTEQGRIV